MQAPIAPNPPSDAQSDTLSRATITLITPTITNTSGARAGQSSGAKRAFRCDDLLALVIWVPRALLVDPPLLNSCFFTVFRPGADKVSSSLRSEAMMETLAAACVVGRR